MFFYVQAGVSFALCSEFPYGDVNDKYSKKICFLRETMVLYNSINELKSVFFDQDPIRTDSLVFRCTKGK